MVSDQVAHVLDRQSRIVTIAGRDRRARSAVLDELRLDGDQDTRRADLGVLRACKLAGSGAAIRVPGPSALLTRNLWYW